MCRKEGIRSTNSDEKFILLEFSFLVLGLKYKMNRETIISLSLLQLLQKLNLPSQKWEQRIPYQQPRGESTQATFYSQHQQLGESELGPCL